MPKMVQAMVAMSPAARVNLMEPVTVGSARASPKELPEVESSSPTNGAMMKSSKQAPSPVSSS
jgi:hypothetical protein